MKMTWQPSKLKRKRKIGYRARKATKGGRKVQRQGEMSTRLPGAKYKRVFDRGRSIKGRLLVAWRLSSPDADRQAGVVVSKKSFHDAVDRNRAKRLMREAYRLLVKSGAMPERTEWVFIGRSALKDRKCQDVMEEMARLASRAS